MTDGQTEACEAQEAESAKGVLTDDLAAVRENIREQQAARPLGDPEFGPEVSQFLRSICTTQDHARLPAFSAILAELDEMQKRKGKDYGVTGDPLANLRASAAFGIPAWVGTIVRANDKMNRVKAFVRNGRLENESIEDSLLDLAVYAIHALRLYREAKGQG
jgi:hypothetical protein